MEEVKAQKFNAAELTEIKQEITQDDTLGSVQGQTISAADLGLEGTPKPAQPSSQPKLYMIHCEICGFKKLTDGTDIADLVPYKQSAIPGGTPYRDLLTGQMVTPKARQNTKKFKCPKCGRVMTTRKVADPKTLTGRSFDE